MNRTEILNGLIELNGYQSYLEIGLGDGANFRHIKCDVKVGIDPKPSINGLGIMKTTSDEYFRRARRSTI